jgi:hypothetical protein
MRPCTVTRAGKRRGHTPSNEELEDCGLKVAPEQGHLPAENRASGEPDWQAAHKARSALIANGMPQPGELDAQLAATMRGVRGPDVGKRKPRVARAKVSKAPRGSVPVTLGGRMPPVSVLARREWGLRALRK